MHPFPSCLHRVLLWGVEGLSPRMFISPLSLPSLCSIGLGVGVLLLLLLLTSVLSILVYARCIRLRSSAGMMPGGGPKLSLAIPDDDRAVEHMAASSSTPVAANELGRRMCVSMPSCCRASE